MSTDQAPSPDLLAIAVTLGRIEESQKHMGSILDEVKSDVKNMSGEVGKHEVKLAEHDEHFKRQDDRFIEYDKALAAIQPIRVHWSAIAAVVIAVMAVLVSGAEIFIKNS